jgi:hypothetical protein
MLCVFRKKPQTSKCSHDPIERGGMGCRHWREFLGGLGALRQMAGQLQRGGEVHQARGQLR